MARPLNVVCFYWQGKVTSGWENTIRGIEYVNKLYRSISKNLTLPFKFTLFLEACLPDNGQLHPNINVHRFNSPIWEGRLPKLYAHSKEAGLQGRIVIVDLDLIVMGSLDEMFSYAGSFMTRAEPRSPNVCGGDIVFFEAGTYKFWEQLCRDPKGILKQTRGGNERFFFRTAFNGKQDFVQTLYPGQIVSYKVHVRGKGRPDRNVRLVSCHGHPKPHELMDLDWIREYWK